jgi:hypothetical protein
LVEARGLEVRQRERRCYRDHSRNRSNWNGDGVRTGRAAVPHKDCRRWRSRQLGREHKPVRVGMGPDTEQACKPGLAGMVLVHREPDMVRACKPARAGKALDMVPDKATGMALDTERACTPGLVGTEPDKGPGRARGPGIAIETNGQAVRPAISVT